MRPIYSQKLLAIFEQRLGAWTPSFSPIKVRSDRLFPGERVFHHDHRDASIYLVWRPDPKMKQSFTIEYGWARKGSFPNLLALRCPVPTASRVEFALTELYQNVSAFARAPLWWPIEEMGTSASQIKHHFAKADIPDAVATERVREASDRAFHWLEENLLPYLREYVSFLDRE